MRILAIETSCDETSLALLEAKGGLTAPKFKVLKHLIASQIKVHEPFGGVVPNLAKREHLKNLPALWTGIEFAKKLSKEWKKPLLGTNHMEGHLYSFLIENKKKLQAKKVFPMVGLLVSGGHTILLLMKDIKTWKMLGETRDDAVGEAFDKVARILDLPYPGGPAVDRLAEIGDRSSIQFPRPMINEKNYDFSYSGLKTAVLYYKRDNPEASAENIAASFQAAATEVLLKKTLRAAKEFKAKSVLMAGGVAASKYLREKLGSEVEALGLNYFVPGFTFNTDNAGMIGAAGYMDYLRKKKYPLKANGSLKI